jgi:hypothetical protein
MRINVYNEELLDEVELIEKTADTGVHFYGIRLFLKSPPELHHSKDDDDRTAITFWFGHDFASYQQMARILKRAADTVGEMTWHK